MVVVVGIGVVVVVLMVDVVAVAVVIGAISHKEPEYPSEQVHLPSFVSQDALSDPYC